MADLPSATNKSRTILRTETIFSDGTISLTHSAMISLSE